MVKISSEIYFKEVLEQMPRLLGLLDRDVSSKTYGCFDRQHWSYATSDIAQARKQEAVLTLALLYKLKRKDNPYYNNNQIIEWIDATLNFWISIQHKNGSFDDLYPNENSFVATAFSSYAISETLLQLKNEIKNREKTIMCLKKAASWLHKKMEIKVLNQESGSALFLYNLFLLTDNQLYKKWAEEKITLLSKEQSREGWFYEYGGADIGYLSLTIDYLGKYYKKTRDERVAEVLKRAVNFIVYFIHPNCTFGGNYGSRNTEYLAPHGFEILSGKIPNARIVSSCIREALTKKTTIAPFSFDDKYMMFYSYTYLQAYLDANKNIKETHAIFQKKNLRNFKEGGIWILNNKKFYLIVNYNKGGSLKVIFKEKGNILNDSGIIIQDLKNRNLTSSCIFNNTVVFSENGLKIKGNLKRASNNKTNPFKNIALRLFQVTFGRNEHISSKVKEILRKKIISNTKKSPIKFSRRVIIKDDNVEIIDKIQNNLKIKKLIVSSKSSFIYGESSNYFQLSDLSSNPIIYTNDILKKFKGNKKLIVARKYNQFGKLIYSKIQ